VNTLRDIDIEVIDGFTRLGPLHLAHAPAPRRRRPLVCGHLHPGVRLRDFDGSGVTVPCFVVESDLLVLPAFGQFTGLQRVQPRPGRRLYAAAAGRVVRIPPE
jgi:metallophosphoesterase superfamily enzyme